jgi:hypothetical protein
MFTGKVELLRGSLETRTDGIGQIAPTLRKRDIGFVDVMAGIDGSSLR